MHSKKAVIIHSGGMDSSLCLALALKEFAPEELLSLSFSYQQRHVNELKQAAYICKEWHVDHAVIDIKCLSGLTRDALTDPSLPMEWKEGEEAPSLVVGRNGLMARLGAIHAHHLGAQLIYMGIMEEEAREVGYRDCSREYISLKEKILRIDLDQPYFEIRTPLVHMTKKETLVLAHQLGVLPFLWKHTISCYEGLPGSGCTKCPACFLRNRGLLLFQEEYPDVDFHSIDK